MILTLWSAFYKSKTRTIITKGDLPKITHVIAAYNEEDIILDKIENTLNLDYPNSKIRNIIVTDGSDDRTVDIVKKNGKVDLFHEDERKGKLDSIDRMIPLITSDLIFFSDANALLSKNSIKDMVVHFEYKKVGAVAGEKMVFSKDSDDASGSGESIYWKYESHIKNCEAKISSTVGAAGELFAIRKKLYETPPKNILVEDLIITMNVIKKGYKIAYESKALAKEQPSKNIREEMKRKVRISAGGIQSIPHLIPLLNFFKYGSVSFFLLSHRIMRWLFAPSALILVLMATIFLLPFDYWVYNVLVIGQTLFYLVALFGGLFAHRSVKVKYLFIPFYFVFMHLCIILGYIQLMFGNNDVRWEKAERK